MQRRHFLIAGLSLAAAPAFAGGHGRLGNFRGLSNHVRFFETEKENGHGKQEKQIERKIFVPVYWEDNGYRNYDGKATYKTRFELPKNLIDQELFLVLGFIDDTEIVYLNGEEIGSVTSLKETEEFNLPDHEIFRGYAIPNQLLKNKGHNNISVIVYDKGGTGGIYEGPIGIATKQNYEILKKTSAKKTSSKKKSVWELFLDSFQY